MAKDCRSKNQVTRQLNTLGKRSYRGQEGQPQYLNIIQGKEPQEEEEWIILPENKILVDDLAEEDLEREERERQHQRWWDTVSAEESFTEQDAYEEPHPGIRLIGPWDDEPSRNDLSQREADLDRLTPKELDIHQLPATPELVRQNATLAEECKEEVTSP